MHYFLCQMIYRASFLICGESLSFLLYAMQLFLICLSEALLYFSPGDSLDERFLFFTIFYLTWLQCPHKRVLLWNSTQERTIKGPFFSQRCNFVFHDQMDRCNRMDESICRWDKALPLFRHVSLTPLGVLPAPNPESFNRGALLPLTKVIFAEVFHDVVIVLIFVLARIADFGC